MNRLWQEKDNRIEDNIIKDVRNLFRLIREIDKKKLLRLKKENETIKYRVIRDIWNFFEYEEEVYYKPVRVGDFWSSNYIEYESNGDKNQTLSVIPS